MSDAAIHLMFDSVRRSQEDRSRAHHESRVSRYCAERKHLYTCDYCNSHTQETRCPSCGAPIRLRLFTSCSYS